MKQILLLLMLFCLSHFAAVAQNAPPVRQEAPEEGLPKFESEPYQLGLLMRGAKAATIDAEEAKKIQAGHMAHIEKMGKSGKLMAAGPMMNNGELRGIFLFKASSMEEAKALAADDPAIKAGRLRMEILPWMGTKNIGMRAMEEFKKNPQMQWTMKKVHFVLLKRGANWATTQTPETQKLQRSHLWHIHRMLKEGKMLTAGPFSGDSEWLGLFVFATESSDEAKAWAEADPLIKSGHFAVEIHPWFVAKEVWP
jgi:uncharacterized protein